MLEMVLSFQPSYRGLTRCYISLTLSPVNDEDLGPVALFQVLLSEGLIPIFHYFGIHAKICIGQPRVHGCTRAGLRAQILPLMPFASR